MWMNKHDFSSSFAEFMEETPQNENKSLLDMASTLYILDNLL